MSRPPVKFSDIAATNTPPAISSAGSVPVRRRAATINIAIKASSAPRECVKYIPKSSAHAGKTTNTIFLSIFSVARI